MNIEYDDHYGDKFNIEKGIRCDMDSFVDTNIKNGDGDLSDTLGTIKCEIEFTETTVHMAYGNHYETGEIELHENIVFESKRIKEECTDEEELTNEIDTKEQFMASNLSYPSQQFHGNDMECHICRKTFHTISGLKRHIIGHTSEKPFVCNVCTRPFLRKSDLKQHILTHTGEKPHTCSICIKSFLLKANLKRHYMSHTREELLELDLCSEILGNLTSREKQHVCNFCDKTFLSTANLRRHLMFHMGEKPFTCHFCEKKFVLKIDLNRHLMSHTNERPFKCEACDKAYSLKKHLKRHMNSHNQREDLVCSICKERFKTRADVKLHKLKHSDNFLEYKVHKNLSLSECDIVNNSNCDANLAIKSQMHTKSHSFIQKCKSFKCKLCQQEFGLKSELEVHLNGHSGEKPFICRICPKKYSEMTDLKRHLCTPSNI